MLSKNHVQVLKAEAVKLICAERWEWFVFAQVCQQHSVTVRCCVHHTTWGACAQRQVGPAHGVCVCLHLKRCQSQKHFWGESCYCLSAQTQHRLITPAVCWALLNDWLSTVPRIGVGCTCNTSKVRKSNFSLYCTLAVFTKIANLTPSPSLQTPSSLAEVYKAGGMHFYFRSLIRFSFLGAPQGKLWSGFVCLTSCSLWVMHQKELLTQPAWRQTQVMGLFYCAAFHVLLTWQIYLKTGIFPKHHQHSNKWEYRAKQT